LKHVEDSNKHIIEEIVHQVGHLPEVDKDARSEKYKIYHQSRVRTGYVGDIISRLMNLTAHLVSSYTSLAFLKNLSEKRKSTSPAVIQVKIR
jgi:hypothetical protein